MKVGLCSAMFLVFLVLKLVGVIAWSWWWVTAPLWGGVALILAVLALTYLGALLYSLYVKVKFKLAVLKSKNKD